MELGIFLSTHGVSDREGQEWWHQYQELEEMRPVEQAQLAERLGFHSVWTGDHVALPEAPSGSVYPIGVKERPHYPPRPNILDGAAVLAAIAQATERIKLGTSVLIAPYRHPLADARQFATIDVLSGGRLILGVGSGWVREEFELLGHGYYARRRSVLEECIQVYDRAWREGAFSFEGRYFRFPEVGVFPRPVQRPRPPIVVGAVSVGTAGLVARRADGVMPVFTRPDSRPGDYAELQDAIRRECEAIGRPTSEIAQVAFASFRLSGPDDAEARRRPRANLGGTPEHVLEDLQAYAEAGYSVVNLAVVAPSATHAETAEQTEWLGRDVLPEARRLVARGDWRRDI